MTPQGSWQRYLFPLVIAGALLWLALQTVGGNSSGKLRFSDALALIRQGGSGIDHVTFHPSTQEVDFRFTTGKTKTTVYPVDQSGYELQQLLESKGIPFDAKRKGSSPFSSILTSLLPFVLLFGFWIFLMRQMRQKGATESGPKGTPLA